MERLSERDKKALVMLGIAMAAVAVLQFGFPASQGSGEAAATASIPASERRLQRLQEIARQRPRAAAEAQAAARALAETERGLLKAATPALASAEMQQIMQELLRAQGVSMQSSEFGAAKPAGEHYAQVPLTVGFTCGIDQWINLMSAIRNAPQVLSTLDLRIVPGDPKNKLIQVRMVVAGYIPAALLSKAKGTNG